mgnify:CR=1 FL=1
MDIKVKSHLKPCAALSIAIMIVALVMTLTGHGMNLGVDFTGGTIMTYNMGEQFETADVEAVLVENGITDAQIAKTGENDTQVQIRISDKENTDDLRSALESKLGEKYANMEYVDISRVGAIAGRDLINNAINYTSKENKQVFLRQVNQPDCVRIEVRDTGDGIEEDKIKLIFDKYYRSENHKREVVGTGLGLSIVKAILKLHNYDYGVNSKLGEGSTFWFAIRTDQQPAPEATPAIAPTEAKKGVDHAKSE